MQQQHQEQKGQSKAPAAAAGPAAGPAAAPAGAGMRDQLRTMNYADGAAAVQPKRTKPVYDEPQHLDDPELAKDDKTHEREGHEYKRMEGRLFVRGVRAQDICQGWLSDCYFAAALAAVAQREPGAIKDAITEQGGDVFKVRFYDVEWDGTATARSVEVDADFPWYQDKNTWAYLQSTAKGELWPAIMEKAYAVFKAGGAGDYDTIGQGGYEGDVMEAVTGRQSDYSEVADMDDDALWQQLKEASANKQAMTAGTYSEKKGPDGAEDQRYHNTGIHGDHAYTVMGVRTRGRGRNKKRFVILRNPWGEGEPTGDGKDDGIFECPLETFKKSYETLTTLE